MGEQNERREPHGPDALRDKQEILAPGKRDVPDEHAVIKDVEQLEPDQVNPLAPPVNTEAGA